MAGLFPRGARSVASLILCASLIACGGGGGGGGTSSGTPTNSGGSGSSGSGSGSGTSNPPTQSGPTYTPNQFAASSTFEARCAAPRTGTDIEGNAFPDVQGSLVVENFWIRSWTQETYLFNDEVLDQNPYLFNDQIDYFETQKTFATTPSGEQKDDFHFAEPTEEFLEDRNSVARASYGVVYDVRRSTPPRDVRVLYTDPNTPASEEVGGAPQLVRGARIFEVDGIDVVNGGQTDAELDQINDALFPRTANESHVFEVQDPGSATRRNVTLVSENLNADPVNLVQLLTTGTGRVGYVLFNTFGPFSSEAEIVNAIDALSDENIDDLILDLRYNGGGLLAIASQLSYMVAGPGPTNGAVFEALRFNDNAGNFNPVTGEINDPVPFYDRTLGFSLSPGVPLPRLDLPRVFVLSTEDTCSASEAVINGLRGIGVEVILIGETTCGKPFGFYPTDNCGITYYTIQFQGVNNQGFGDYADGFVPADSTFPFGVRLPGCEVADDKDTPLGDPDEALLAAALQYRRDGTCPSGAGPSGVSPASTALGASLTTLPGTGAALSVDQSFIRSNRMMDLPNGKL